MIIIPRKAGESVVIGENIIVTVIEIQGDKVRLRIEDSQGSREVCQAAPQAELALRRPR